MKKLLLSVLCLTALIAYSDEIVIDNIKYQIENDKVILIDGSACSGNLVIPHEVKYNETVYIVSKIGENAFKQNEKITSVVFPPSIEIIGEGAFSRCINIESIEFSEGLTEIGARAFLHCSKPYYIVLPSSLQAIKESAFGGLTNIKEIYSKSMTPPRLAFDYSVNGIADDNGLITSAYPFGSNTSKITLFVPLGASESYKNADGWQCSKEIIETDNWTVSIDKIDLDLTSSEDIIIYNIDGTVIDTNWLSSGIYIIKKRIGNQSVTQKILVR